MTDERRYTDEEIREIFGAATEAGPGGRTPSTGTGMTLREIQEIADEVGISPERIAAAAAALDRHPPVTARRRMLGMPIGVGRAVDLPRAPTDREWEMIVADLRETFGARGRVTELRNLREWRNGNLHASIEPTETGYRLRMGTVKGEALSMTRIGFGAVLIAMVMFVAFMLTASGAGFEGPLILAAMGGAAIASSAIRLPWWARERERQMEEIAARTVDLIGRSGEPEPSES